MSDKEVHKFLVPPDKDAMATKNELQNWYVALKLNEVQQEWSHAIQSGSGNIYTLSTQ